MVVRALYKNPAIDIQGKVIMVTTGTPFVGNGTLGKLSYLVNYCGYSSIRVNNKEALNKLKDLTKRNSPAKPKRLDIAEKGKVVLRKLK